MKEKRSSLSIENAGDAPVAVYTVSESSFLLNPPSEQHPVTVSFGVAAYAGDRKRMFNEADRALYLAKDSGRDCVMVAGRASVI